MKPGQKFLRFGGIISHLWASKVYVTHNMLTLPTLDAVWNGTRILQIADTHFGKYYSRRYWQQVLDKAAEIKPQLIVFTGDIAQYGQQYFKYAKPVLQQLTAPLGKLACLGNHDYSDFAKGNAARQLLKDTGYRVLKNQAIALEKDGKKLWISGIDDSIGGKPDIEKALRRIPVGAPHLCLAHNPDLADILGQHPSFPQAILSGHTHGGHWRIPGLNWLRSALFGSYKYLYGKYHVGNSDVHVSSGLARAICITLHEKPENPPMKRRFIEFPPLRIGTHPEMNVFTLTNGKERP